jgi:hypothetical protein
MKGMENSPRITKITLTHSKRKRERERANVTLTSPYYEYKLKG